MVFFETPFQKHFNNVGQLSADAGYKKIKWFSSKRHLGNFLQPPVCYWGLLRYRWCRKAFSYWKIISGCLIEINEWMSKAPAVPQARRHQLSTVATHTKQKQLLQPTGCSSCNCWLFESKNITFHCFKQIKGLFNTPGTAGGPGGRDRTLAVKSLKNYKKIDFFS